MQQRQILVVCVTMIIVVAMSVGLPWVAQSLQNGGEQWGARNIKGPTKSFAPSCLRTAGGPSDAIRMY